MTHSLVAQRHGARHVPRPVVIAAGTAAVVAFALPAFASPPPATPGVPSAQTRATGYAPDDLLTARLLGTSVADLEIVRGAQRGREPDRAPSAAS